MDQGVDLLLYLLKTSAYLRTEIPLVRRRALEETLRNSDYKTGIDILLENISGSPYIPDSQKEQLANLVFEKQWTQLKEILKCIEMDDVPIDTSSFQKMVLSIFLKSKKIGQLPLERKVIIGEAILQSNSVEYLKELAISSLESSETMDEPRRQRIANAILDQRYDLLLLPDYFDCDEVPRKRTVHSQEQVSPSIPEEQEEEEECPICLGTNPLDSQLSCGHQFCHRCLNHWSQRQNTCPLCRRQQVSWEQVSHLIIPNNSRVKVHGLVSSSHLNEQTAIVSRFEISSGRFIVSLEDGRGPFKIKIDNLMRL